MEVVVELFEGHRQQQTVVTTSGHGNDLLRGIELGGDVQQCEVNSFIGLGDDVWRKEVVGFRVGSHTAHL